MSRILELMFEILLLFDVYVANLLVYVGTFELLSKIRILFNVYLSFSSSFVFPYVINLRTNT